MSIGFPVESVSPARIRAGETLVPLIIAATGNHATIRFLEFFAANIRNPHTRRAYGRAVSDFLAWCAGKGVPSIGAVQPLHVAAWLELQGKTLAAPTVKQRLAAVRHLFDWLVVGQVVPVNPAASVRGPRHVVKVGKTPVLDPAEARSAGAELILRCSGLRSSARRREILRATGSNYPRRSRRRCSH